MAANAGIGAPRQCLLCGGLEHRTVFQEFGTDVLQCRRCEHVFSSHAGEVHYDGFWGDKVPDIDHVYWKTLRGRMYEEFIGRFVSGRSGRLLDMGCGLGFFLERMRDQAGWQSYGCEISPAAVRYAQNTLGLGNVMCTRLEEASWPAESFDIVTMWDVIDHILEPDPLLERCHALLKDGGICFMRTPNVTIQLARARLRKLVWGMRPDVTYLQAREHLHQYSTASIRRLLERNGFGDIEFLHFRPIDSVSHGNSPVVRGIRDALFQAVRALAVVTGGRLNFDNLFVLGRKRGLGCSR